MASYFAGLIEADEDFELTTAPELCLLTYRYVPALLQSSMAHSSGVENERINKMLNGLTEAVQVKQCELGGVVFVSRTTLALHKHNGQEIVVFRVVLANPLTST